ncbi:MAG: helix-turn-helix transcriptional regulator [Nitrososphaeria archaeon]|nr:helix-turn-helix transcriptional regulator [Nitrososphaeria archaeon]
MDKDFTFFDSKGKFKILRILLKENEINISALLKRTKISYKFIERYLTELESEGLIKQKRFGKIRIISLEDNRVTRILKDFFTELEDIEEENYIKGYI